MSKAKTPAEKAAAKVKRETDKANLAAKSQAKAPDAESNNQANDSSDQSGLSEKQSTSSDQGGLSEKQSGSSDHNGLSEKFSGSSDQGGLKDSAADRSERLTIVIPYLKAKAQGPELLLAIRSIAKNFIYDNYQLVVIGDKEDWFSDQILFIDKPCIGINPQADVIDKMKTILLEESIGEIFIWTNDDIYFVAPTTSFDISILKTDGDLKEVVGNSGTYNLNRARTIKALQRIGRPIRNFATHTPVVYEKEKMMDVFEVFQKELAEGMLLSSAYFNLHFGAACSTSKINWEKDRWSLRVVSDLKSEEKKALFRKLITKKHFLNHSEAGFSKLLVDWLFRQFPEKCRFEK